MSVRGGSYDRHTTQVAGVFRPMMDSPHAGEASGFTKFRFFSECEEGFHQQKHTIWGLG